MHLLLYSNLQSRELMSPHLLPYIIITLTTVGLDSGQDGLWEAVVTVQLHIITIPATILHHAQLQAIPLQVTVVGVLHQTVGVEAPAAPHRPRPLHLVEGVLTLVRDLGEQKSVNKITTCPY